MERNKQKELPKVDLPEPWLAGTDIDPKLLNLYADFPVRLKCEMVILCRGGEVEASVNLNRIAVHADSLVVLTPGTIFQVHRVDEDLKIYFLGFSSEYVKGNCSKHLIEACRLSSECAVLPIGAGTAAWLEDSYRLMIRLYASLDEKGRAAVIDNLFADIHLGIHMLCRNTGGGPEELTKNKQLFRSFARLVTLNYAHTRQVTWYAEQLQVSHAYLCSVVKEVSGTTCTDIISSMVIMDAKSQLKLTDASVQAISDSLNFANISFFGKYFKRYVGMSPLEYRLKG